jgi:Protein kinase domain
MLRAVHGPRAVCWCAPVSLIYSYVLQAAQDADAAAAQVRAAAAGAAVDTVTPFLASAVPSANAAVLARYCAALETAGVREVDDFELVEASDLARCITVEIDLKKVKRAIVKRWPTASVAVTPVATPTPAPLGIGGGGGGGGGGGAKRTFDGGRYEEQFELGRGAFAVVLHVVERLAGGHTGRHAALKLLPVDAVTAATVPREAAALAALDHPNVVRYYHSFIESGPEGQAFGIAMELMDCTLDRMFFAGPRVDIGTVRHLGLCLARGLAYLHGRPTPVYHGDVKAENAGARRGEDGAWEFKLLDFGSAISTATVASAGRASSRTGRSAFTPTYANAARVGCEVGPCEPDDMWAYGWLLVELVRGERVTRFDPRITLTSLVAPAVIDRHVAAVARADAGLGGVVARALGRAEPPLHARDAAGALAGAEMVATTVEFMCVCAAAAAAPPPVTVHAWRALQERRDGGVA